MSTVEGRSATRLVVKRSASTPTTILSPGELSEAIPGNPVALATAAAVARAAALSSRPLSSRRRGGAGNSTVGLGPNNRFVKRAEKLIANPTVEPPPRLDERDAGDTGDTGDTRAVEASAIEVSAVAPPPPAVEPRAPAQEEPSVLFQPQREAQMRNLVPLEEPAPKRASRKGGGAGESLEQRDKVRSLRKSTWVKSKDRDGDASPMTEFLSSVGKHELLSAQEEVLLARKIQLKIKAEERRTTLGDALGREPEQAEWARELYAQLERKPSSMLAAGAYALVAVVRGSRSRTRGQG